MTDCASGIYLLLEKDWFGKEKVPRTVTNWSGNGVCETQLSPSVAWRYGECTTDSVVCQVKIVKMGKIGDKWGDLNSARFSTFSGVFFWRKFYRGGCI